MSDEEKPIDLRDKFALEILNALVSKIKDNDLDFVVNHRNSSYQSYKDHAEKTADSLVQTAYYLADKMRKYRLVSFT